MEAIRPCSNAGSGYGCSAGAGIGPALLARAYCGDAAAQVLVGEIYAADKGVVQVWNQAAE